MNASSFTALTTFQRYAARVLLSLLPLLFLFAGELSAGINASPKYIFLDGSRRSTPVAITNIGREEIEAWVEVKYGYVTSDDTGKVDIVYDSAADEPSAAAWVKAYPSRFILSPGESQTIRLAASAPPAMRDGEYWARVLVTGKPRKPPAPVAGGRFQTGMVIITQLSLAFHYRVGMVATGVIVSDPKVTSDDRNVQIVLKLTRTGNASFWGTRLIRILDASGKAVGPTVRKNVVVYKTLNVREVLDRKTVPPGRYTLDVELLTDKRTDLPRSSLVQSPPAHLAIPIIIP